MQTQNQISNEEITVLILAGGRGSRVQGRDKGLIPLLGKPAIEHLLARILPQSSRLLISANRNLDRYSRYGYPVVRDTLGGFAGPLAGILAGFGACQTSHMLTLPVDAPLADRHYLARMKRSLEQTGSAACVAEFEGQMEPVFCLAECRAQATLEAYLEAGQRSAQGWLKQLGATRVDFSDVPQQFINLNQAGDQIRLEALLRA